MERLLDLPYSRIRALASSGAPVVLGVNPVEYHGPHLSLRNDALIARGLARALIEAARAGGRDWPWLYAGDLDAGVDPIRGPGSRPVSYREVARRVRAACRQLCALGAQRVVLTSFHGSPLHNLAIAQGARWLRARGVPAFTPMDFFLRELIGVDLGIFSEAWAHVRDPDERRALVERLPFDLHAGFLETSLALHLAPDTVSGHREVPPCRPYPADPGVQRAARLAARLGRHELARELDFLARGVAWYALDPFPGYTGSPHLATAASGAVLVEWIIPRMLEAAEATLLGGAPTPRPILAWSGPATLWGRLPRGTEPEVVQT